MHDLQLSDGRCDNHLVPPREAVPQQGHPSRNRRSVLLTGLASDAHTWGLVYLQLVLEELGHQVSNLGSCVPPELLLTRCLQQRPDLVVVSSVNGHGRVDGARAVRGLREHPDLSDLPVVIGGQLGICGRSGSDLAGELVAAGYTAVFDSAAGMSAFLRFLLTVPSRIGR